MGKDKIAISIDSDLLSDVDSYAKESLLGSRSQAISYLLRKGMEKRGISVGVIMLHRKHLPLSMKSIKGTPLILHQAKFFKQQGIQRIYVLTGIDPKAEELQETLSRSGMAFEIIQTKAEGNAEALHSLKKRIDEDFVVISGDVLMDISMGKMISEHLHQKRFATIGLMTRSNPQKFGACVMQGSLITNFYEKSKQSESHVVNAGIYVFSPKIFAFLESSIKSIEHHLLPKLAKLELLFGYFIKGIHEDLD